MLDTIAPSCPLKWGHFNRPPAMACSRQLASLARIQHSPVCTEYLGRNLALLLNRLCSDEAQCARRCKLLTKPSTGVLIEGSRVLDQILS